MFAMAMVYRLLGATAYGSGYESSRPYHIIDLNCNGNESTVWNCSYNTKSHGCYDYERARIRCPGIIIKSLMFQKL